jgi:hypothetical protein
MIKNIKKMLTRFEVNNMCNYIKYPWGWMPLKDKLMLKENLPKNDIYVEDKSRLFYHQYHFRIESKDAYNLVYQKYLDKVDFFDYSFTTPSLSLALNYLHESSDTSNLKDSIEIKDTEIIGTWLEYGNIEINHSLFNINNTEQLKHELIIGAIGPEIRYLWDQQAIKQVVRTSFQSEDFYDIIDWERSIMIPNQEWQIKNINNLIKF